MAQFGELLAELREDRKLTQKELSEVIYVSPGTISNYENGVHYPDIDKLVMLADYFHVTTDYLLGRCSANLSPDVFDEIVTGELTVGSMVRDIRCMTPERRQALAIILSDMRFRMIIGQYGKRRSHDTLLYFSDR